MVDDEKSIYVGGIPYDCTEEALRCVFDLYGAVTAIKIINDKKVGGKCFAFVTFSNPRSAQDAIMDMNGRTIGGRIVRVNEVRTRTNNHTDSYHESFSHGTSQNRGPYQYRYGNRYRPGSSRESSFDSPKRDQPLDRDRNEDRPLDRAAKRDRSLDRNGKRDRSLDRISDREWSEDRPLDRGGKRDRSLDRISDQDEGLNKGKRDGSMDRFSDLTANKEVTARDKAAKEGRLKEGRESGENDDRFDELRGLLKKRVEKHDDIQRKVDILKDRIDEKKHDISHLQKKSQKLEDGLVSTRKIVSERKLLLSKVHRCFAQYMSYTEKIKVSEKELAGLINEATNETDKDESFAHVANNISPFINGHF